MTAPAKFLPYGRQTIEDDDIAAVTAALQSDFLTTGPLVEAFERDFAAATGAMHTVACNSGTAALHLAMLALDCGPGDSVVVPTMTFLSTANVVRMTGAEVIFADVDPETGLMMPRMFDEALARAGGRPVKAALPVHLNGRPCAMPDLQARAQAKGIALVEDACHALGIPSIGSTSHSRMACFSTHPVKAIATGEGGVVATADADLASRMRRLRNHAMTRNVGEFANAEMARTGRTANPWYYEMQELGWNYRLPDILCALGLSQLKKLKRFHHRRRELAELYDRLLQPLAPTLRPVSNARVEHGWHLYAVLVDFADLGMNRATVMDELRGRGIGTQVHYIPVHRQPYYRELYGDVELPGADLYYAKCLSLPFYPAMTDDDVRRVVGAVSQVLNG